MYLLNIYIYIYIYIYFCINRNGESYSIVLFRFFFDLFIVLIVMTNIGKLIILLNLLFNRINPCHCELSVKYFFSSE